MISTKIKNDITLRLVNKRRQGYHTWNRSFDTQQNAISSVHDIR